MRSATGWSWAAAVLGLLMALSGASEATAATAMWDPRVAIVWPQDGQGRQASVAQSRAVNVALWPANQVNCSPPPGLALSGLVTLAVAKDNEPARPVTIAPQWILRTTNGATFPSVKYDNVPAELAADPTARYSFAVVGGLLVGGSGETGNVWVHAADARTIYPRPVVPVGYVDGQLTTVDLRIQIVWPHDGEGNYAPVGRATFVNVAVDLFEHGTLESVRPDFPPPDLVNPPTLGVARDNGPLRGSGVPAQKVTYEANGQAYPRWVFNDVPVEPGTPYHFMAEIGGRFAYHSEYSSIWTHAADARTINPTPQAPPACT